MNTLTNQSSQLSTISFGRMAKSHTLPTGAACKALLPTLARASMLLSVLLALPRIGLTQLKWLQAAQTGNRQAKPSPLASSAPPQTASLLAQIDPRTVSHVPVAACLAVAIGGN